MPTSKHSLKERLARYRQIKITSNLATAASLPTHGFPGKIHHPRGSRGRLLGFRAFLKPLMMEANGFGHVLSSWRVGRLGGIPALSMPG